MCHRFESCTPHQRKTALDLQECSNSGCRYEPLETALRGRRRVAVASPSTLGGRSGWRVQRLLTQERKRNTDAPTVKRANPVFEVGGDSVAPKRDLRVWTLAAKLRVAYRRDFEMPKQSFFAQGQWILVADAGPAYKTSSRYAPQIVAFRIHRGSTNAVPDAEGGIHVGDTGINKAEYLAVIQGLKLLADRMYVGDWARDPVNVVTDNAFVVNQALGRWEASELGYHLARLNELVNEIFALTQNVVYFIHAGAGESRGADTLARAFRGSCDPRRRKAWNLARFQERWPAVRDYVRQRRKNVLFASLASAWVSSYDGRTLELSFPPGRSTQKSNVEQRIQDLRHAIDAVMGWIPTTIRCRYG
jgi:ribonuclease HI